MNWACSNLCSSPGNDTLTVAPSFQEEYRTLKAPPKPFNCKFRASERSLARWRACLRRCSGLVTYRSQEACDPLSSSKGVLTAEPVPPLAVGGVAVDGVPAARAARWEAPACLVEEPRACCRERRSDRLVDAIAVELETHPPSRSERLKKEESPPLVAAGSGAPRPCTWVREVLALPPMAPPRPCSHFSWLGVGHHGPFWCRKLSRNFKT
mmetsp:Transcript_25532/g.59450  ORF Transcript_25532/g.59450 Transcript_25532/m.59450 type:complete len:210 (-) Transcript_25532:9-638(-)